MPEIAEAIEDLGGAPKVMLAAISTEADHVHHIVGIDPEHGLQETYIDDEEFHNHPRRSKGERTVSEVGSFLAELDRRPLDGAGTLWGSATNGTITAVYNDHTSNVPGWRDDRLKLVLKPDPDWTAWHKLSGQYLPQEQFGDHIEELRHTISSPDQADLLEIIHSIRASTRGEFDSSIDRARGGQKLTYKKEVSAKAGAVGRELEVPQHIILQLQPWEGHGQLYEVNAYFRLNITEGHLKLAVKLFPTREILRTAWNDVTAKVTDALDGQPVYAQ